MNHLHRELAPISDAAWEQIDEEAREALGEFLAARRLVDFSGPHGWQHAAVPTGAVEPVDAGGDDDVQIVRRSALQLLEVRVPFRVDHDVLREIDRGSPAADLDVLVAAARRAAATEDTAIFDGIAPAGIVGCASGSDHDPLTSAGDLTATVTEASATLHDAGVHGPFGLALGPELWRTAMATSDDGYPLSEHLRLLVEGPVVRARTIPDDEGVLLSQRGGDFELIVGQDFAIGYAFADSEGVSLYLTETFTFRNLEPAAAMRISVAAIPR